MTNTFPSQTFQTRYRSGDYFALPREFYNQVLPCTKKYFRAVGFFSSTSFIEISYGILEMVKNGGKMYLITSPRLSDDDIAAIEKGYEGREEIYLRAFKREMKLPTSINAENRLNILANLIEEGILEIKIAVTENPRSSMYHEKIGLFVDGEGNKIAISGSNNESETAISENFESFQVFCGWYEGDRKRVETVENDFNMMWENRQEALSVFSFPALPKAFVEKYKKEKVKDYNDVKFDDVFDFSGGLTAKNLKPNIPTLPSWLKLHDYQKEAIAKWAQQNYRGIFDMATGTGKTLTGLSGLARLFSDTKGEICAVILCPYIHLVTQWVEDIVKFNIKPIIAFGSSSQKDWKERLERAVYKRNGKNDEDGFFCLITTIATFKGEYVQKQISRIKKDILVIADEAHNLGSQGAREYLHSQEYKYRLALSATLDRHFDEAGTKSLYDFFGEKCIEYGLEQAINEGFLVPYYYYPIVVSLNEDERERYLNLTKSISQEIKKDTKTGRMKLSEQGKLLCIIRSKIIASCAEKNPALIRAIEPYKDKNMILIYCGAVKFNEDKDFSKNDEDEKRQIDEVIKLIYEKYRMKICRFTAETKIQEREIIKQKFAEGNDIQTIVAIKCLDEGVNIPSIKTAFILASSTNPKEYIQRRGRVLRTFPEKEFAEIFDFVTLPYDIDSLGFKSEFETQTFKALAKNELERIKEFSSLAKNGFDSYELIKKIEKKFSLSDKTQDLEENIYE